MSNEKGYNGWSNYETWCVNLWITNDEGIYETVRDLVRQMSEEEDYKIAEAIKEYIYELYEVDNTSFQFGLFNDLLTSALSEVDWYEIASYFIDEWKEENKEELTEEEATEKAEEVRDSLREDGKVVN